ncbi:SUP35, partial [Symbiodinium necroappetens]
LDQYARNLAEAFNSPTEVQAMYLSTWHCALDAQFFEDFHIHDLRHQKMFRRWFEAQGTARPALDENSKWQEKTAPGHYPGRDATASRTWSGSWWDPGWTGTHLLSWHPLLMTRGSSDGHCHFGTYASFDAKDPCNQAGLADCEKVPLRAFASLRKLKSRQGSDIQEPDRGTSFISDEDSELLREDSAAEEDKGVKWEFFDLDNVDHIISEDVLPTILEDETLQMPLLTARSALERNSWGISEAFQSSFEALSSVAIGIGSFAGTATQGVLEATHAFLSCSIAFDAFVEMHVKNDENTVPEQETEDRRDEA